MNNRMLALYGLKWNPFTPNVPTEALHVTTRLESFCWRVQQLAGDGGFALVTGVPGCGKSAALRILSASLATQRDVEAARDDDLWLQTLRGERAINEDLVRAVDEGRVTRQEVDKLESWNITPLTG